jgi:hypothetical protein
MTYASPEGKRWRTAMLGNAWVGLIQRIPAQYHDNLAVVLSTGAEVVIQSIASLEPEYMVIRGRTAGSTDGGRVFIVPFDQVQYLGFQRVLSEPDLRAIFGGEAPSFAAMPVPVDTPAKDSPPEPTPTPPAVEPPAAGPAPQKAAPISKSILLARLRARLGNDRKVTER